MSGRSTTVLGVLLIAIAVLFLWWTPTWSEERVPAEPDSKDQATETLEAPNREEGQPAETAPARSTIETPPTADEKPKRSRKELWGRVIRRSDKAPVANATVRLLHAVADEFFNLDRELRRDVRELARTTTTTDGSFHFSAPHTRKHRLEVVAAGHPRVTRANCVGGVEITVQLDVAATLGGRVTADGKPVAGALVRVTVQGDPTEYAKSRTDIDGAFHFGDLPAATAWVNAESPRFAFGWKSIEIEAGKHHTVDLQLKKGRCISGKVLAKATGTPISGAQIAESWIFDGGVRSAADGSFEIQGVDSTEYAQLFVRAEGFADAHRMVEVELEGKIVFHLVTAGSVTGRFVDRDGKAPSRIYAAAAASYRPTPGMENTDWIRAVVEPSGHFTISGLRPDLHYWLYVRGRGYGARFFALPRKLKSDERHDVGTFVLHPAGGIEGRVVDEHDKPRASITVRLNGANSDSRARLTRGARPRAVSQLREGMTTTDRDGRFFFDGLSVGTYEVSARRKGNSQNPKRTVQVQDGVVRRGVGFVFAIGKVIEGVVRYPDGRVPQAGTLWLLASREGKGVAGSVVDSEGRFRFAGLEDGDYSVSVAHQRRVKDWTLRSVHRVHSGTRDLQLQLERALTVTGRVVDADGNPLRAWVWCRRDDSNQGSSSHQTGDDGRFQVHVAPDFIGTFYAIPPNADRMSSIQAKVERVRAGQRDLELRLKRLR